MTNLPCSSPGVYCGVGVLFFSASCASMRALSVASSTCNWDSCRDDSSVSQAEEFMWIDFLFELLSFLRYNRGKVCVPYAKMTAAFFINQINVKYIYIFRSAPKSNFSATTHNTKSSKWRKIRQYFFSRNATKLLESQTTKFNWVVSHAFLYWILKWCVYNILIIYFWAFFVTA